MARKIFSWVALVLLEAVLITSFIIFGSAMPTGVLVTDIVVSTIILALLFIDIMMPWHTANDGATQHLGAMGVRWVVTIVYAVAAIAVMVLMQNYSFTTQLLVQGGLLAVMLLGMAGVFSSKEKIGQVYQQESTQLSDREQVRSAWHTTVEKLIDGQGMPEDVIERVKVVAEQLRYVSPSNSAQAKELDEQLIACAESLRRMSVDYELNKERVAAYIDKAMRLIEQRKSAFSR
ncbi:MAG: hypothetical protein IJ761_08240 [Bacteroidales bacterium]|nr:hypothetical protein [Bacteroidales bacterium]MBR1799863.1 hypothetical protein [Bacteroidales bacterium]